MSDDVMVNDCDILVEKFAKSQDLRFASFARLCNASNLAPILYVVKFEHRTIIFTFLTFCFDLCNNTSIKKSFLCSGRSSKELPLLAGELLAKAKAIILNRNNEFASRVGGLYLLYGLYFTQKSKYVH